MLDDVFETAWGRIRVKGRLGQQHADVLEAILRSGQKPKELGDGRIKLLVDPAEVRRMARQPSTSTFHQVRDELMQALIEIIEPVRLAGVGHLIDHIDFARRPDGQFIVAANPLGGERHLWRVDLGKALCKLIDVDLWVHRDPAPIAALRHGISQAVARHVLSHKRGSCSAWTIDTLIHAVSGELSSQQLWDRRTELRADRAALAALGVTWSESPRPWSKSPPPWSKSSTPGAKAGQAQVIQASQEA